MDAILVLTKGTSKCIDTSGGSVMANSQLRKWILAGLMAALAAIGTMLIQVPIPSNAGFVHLGDSMVYLCGILLGPGFGALAAGVGSAIADLMLGYSVYAPATLIIKALDAMAVGFIYCSITKNHKSIVVKSVAYFVAIAVGSAVMVGGYYFYELFFLKLGAASLAGLIPNSLQGLVDGVLAYPLLIALEGVKIIRSKDVATHS